MRSAGRVGAVICGLALLVGLITHQGEAGVASASSLLTPVAITGQVAVALPVAIEEPDPIPPYDLCDWVYDEMRYYQDQAWACFLQNPDNPPPCYYSYTEAWINMAQLGQMLGCRWISQ